VHRDTNPEKSLPASCIPEVFAVAFTRKASESIINTGALDDFELIVHFSFLPVMTDVDVHTRVEVLSAVPVM